MLHLNVSNVNGHSSVSSFTNKKKWCLHGNERKMGKRTDFCFLLFAIQLLPCIPGWPAQTVLMSTRSSTNVTGKQNGTEKLNGGRREDDAMAEE